MSPRGNGDGGTIGLARSLPHNIDAEMSLLGTLLHLGGAGLLPVATAILKPDSFGYLPHRSLFREITDRAADGRPFDAVELKLWADDDTVFLSVGSDYLGSLMDCGDPARTNFKQRCELVARLALERQLDELGKLNSPPKVLEAQRILAEIQAIGQPAPGSCWKLGNEMTARDIAWLWHNRFIAGRINILAGMGDVGKDVFCCMVAACVTTGRDWPDGEPGCVPGVVGIISPEDDPEDTILPRLITAGADMNNIRIWCSRQRPTPADLAGLKLLIVSPLINLMDGQKDMNREQDARDFLGLWQEGSKAHACTVLGTAHLNKKSDLAVAQRILGASGIVNFVRSNWTIQRDVDDKTLRLFMRLKANLTPDETDGLKFNIRHIGPNDQSIRCEWAGTTDKTPDDVMAARRDSRDGGDKASASKWLVAYLAAHGETLRSEIMAAAASADFKEEAVRKAKNRNPNVVEHRDEFQGPYYWRLDE